MIIGLGPGPAKWLTPEAAALLSEATDIVGYAPYVARVPPSAARRHASDNRVEMARARQALQLAADGARVALVSGGDPGIFAMAGALLEALERGPAAWRSLDIHVAPGITAMLAAAARVGAPLGHDFCCLSLSDNLKPWSAIEKRLTAAIDADFVIVLYNPASKTRRAQIERAFGLLLAKGGERIVILAKNIGRESETIIETTLSRADPGQIDMATLVIIGSTQTRRIARPDGAAWILTPRSMS